MKKFGSVIVVLLTVAITTNAMSWSNPTSVLKGDVCDGSESNSDTISTAHVQDKNNNRMLVSGQGWYGYDIEHARPEQASNRYMTYELALGFQTEPADSNLYDKLFGYPTLYAGFSVARMGNFQFKDNTKFPNLYSLFGSFERTLFRNKYTSLGYHLDFGATYNPATYDPLEGVGNNWLSSHFMAYVGAGAFAKFHIGKRWEIGADISFRHYSNGRLRLPNEALNAIGGGVFVRYRLADYEPIKYKRSDINFETEDFKKGMQYTMALGGGVHTCQAEWNQYAFDYSQPDKPERIPTKEEAASLKAHPKFSYSFEATYRYAPRYATGLGVEVFYSSNMKHLKTADTILYGEEAVANSPGYSPISIGIAVVQEVYWRNLAVHVALGAYPYRHKGVDDKELNEMYNDRERGWHYEKAGLRYYIPKLGDTFVGLSIKSHNIKAEYLELSLGWRFKGKSIKKSLPNSKNNI